jgi:tripartite-type tricarboxylate transporter receptor subunit TctC
MTRLWSLAAAFALCVLAATASAQPVAEFYKGKTITFVVGFTAGGNYDFYARLLAEFMGKHVPGNPQFVVQNRAGAGSRNAAAYVYNVAPKDGTVIAMTTNLLPLFQVLDASPKFDLSKAHFLGNMTETVSVVALWHTAPAKTLDEAKTVETVLGSTGKGGETYIVPQMMNAVLGTKFKIVLGYPGINEITLAMERGELHGRSASWDNLTQQRPEWLREKKVNILAQIGLRKERELPHVPLIVDLAANADDRALLELVSGYPAFARAPWLAAEVPADRIAALRKAFDDTMKDAAFLRTAKERNTDITPSTGATVQAAVNRLIGTPPALVAKARAVLAIGAE